MQKEPVMFTLSRTISRRARVMLSAVALGFGGIALAQTEPAGFVVSPEIYKVIAENTKFRVVEVTWKPGQKEHRGWQHCQALGPALSALGLQRGRAYPG